ncbi:MAG: sigma-70 family RNA polymerase sigma factor [Planctomycetes bacterium]|nr:sigma-70 family RNA polymerase sigma factor [Planctomycetota bacterium]
MTTPQTHDETIDLLQRWHGGDRAALGELLERHLPKLREFVRTRLDLDARHVRRDQDSLDLTQHAAVRVLEYMPRFVPRDGQQFQALLRRIVTNALINEVRAPKHRLREQRNGGYGDSMLDLRSSPHSSMQPERAIAAREQADETRAWARMALEFLDDECDRQLVLLAAVDERPWNEIGEATEMTPDAARMRFKRVMPKLANRIRMLREGRIDELLEQFG